MGRLEDFLVSEPALRCLGDKILLLLLFPIHNGCQLSFLDCRSVLSTLTIHHPVRLALLHLSALAAGHRALLISGEGCADGVAWWMGCLVDQPACAATQDSAPRLLLGNVLSGANGMMSSVLCAVERPSRVEHFTRTLLSSPHHHRSHLRCVCREGCQVLCNQCTNLTAKRESTLFRADAKALED